MIFVCEDEKTEREKLLRLIKATSPDVSVTVFESAEEMLRSAAFCEAKTHKTDVKKTIILRSGASTKTVRLSDILYIESSVHQVLVHTINGKFPVSLTMSGIEEALDKRFFRCHRSFIINMDNIDRYTATDIYLSDGTAVMLSRYRYHPFVEAYCAYMTSVRNSHDN